MPSACGRGVLGIPALDPLTSQTWSPPHSNGPMGHFWCFASPDMEVDIKIPTILLSHLKRTLQSIDRCGQSQLWSQAPKSLGATWL